jgi:very-short-patch-repair endonuclease
MTTKRKARLNEIYELLRNTLASHKIIINKSQHLELVMAYCELKQVLPPIHFTPKALQDLLTSTQSPVPISSSKPIIKKKRTKSKSKTRQAILVTPEMTKQQVAAIYQADLIKFATRAERRVKTLLNQINKEIIKLDYEFQKVWIDTPGKEFYISDFFIRSLSLTLEIDGQSHNVKSQKDKDNRKELHLISLGIRTIRITNAQVKNMKAAYLHRLLAKST